MSKQPGPASRIPLAVQVIALPLWWGISITLMGALLMFLWQDQTAKRTVSPEMVYSSANQSYRLFTALPTKRQVLGQHVDYKDARVLKLQRFLEYYNSPMSGAAASFVETADKYRLPWTLLPAIACKESGCGRAIPTGSFNAFGWAVYTGQNSGAAFNSWAAAIDRVGRGLREDYFDDGLDTVPEIETRYTPPSANGHGGWRTHVQYFMSELESWSI